MTNINISSEEKDKLLTLLKNEERPKNYISFA